MWAIFLQPHIHLPNAKVSRTSLGDDSSTNISLSGSFAAAFAKMFFQNVTLILYCLTFTFYVTSSHTLANSFSLLDVTAHQWFSGSWLSCYYVRHFIIILISLCKSTPSTMCWFSLPPIATVQVLDGCPQMHKAAFFSPKVIFCLVVSWPHFAKWRRYLEWNLVLFITFLASRTECILADDSTLSNRTQIQNKLDKLEKWSVKHRVKFSKDKCNFL